MSYNDPYRVVGVVDDPYVPHRFFVSRVDKKIRWALSPCGHFCTDGKWASQCCTCANLGYRWSLCDICARRYDMAHGR